MQRNCAARLCFCGLALATFAASLVVALPDVASSAPAGRRLGVTGPMEVGVASWYGAQHQGRLTASGAPFDMHKLTAAHPRLPLNSKVLVTNLENGKSVEVTINDRGPGVEGRLIDLSERAASTIGMKDEGLALVRVEPLGRASPDNSQEVALN